MQSRKEVIPLELYVFGHRSSSLSGKPPSDLRSHNILLLEKYTLVIFFFFCKLLSPNIKVLNYSDMIHMFLYEKLN